MKKIVILIVIIMKINACPQQPDIFSNTVITVNTPVSVIKKTDNHYFFDFGKDGFGKIALRINNPHNGTLIIHAGEKLSSAQTVDRNPGGAIRFQTVKLATISSRHSYIVPFMADTRNSNPPAMILPDSFGVIMPFRYVEIENLACPIREVSVKRMMYTCCFNDTASYFSCNDTILNQVWELCKYSIKATSFCGVYVDGDRERIPYEADAFINQLGHYCVDNHYGMARNTNEYFMRHPTWPTEWLLHTVLLFYFDFLYTGDTEPLRKHYEALKVKTLTDLEREDGLITSQSEKVDDVFMRKLGFENEKQRIRDIVDWPPSQSETSWKLAAPEGERDGYEMKEINTVVNAFYYQNMKLMAEIATALGREGDAALFQKKASRVAATINAILFNKNEGVYIDGVNSTHASLHAYMIPLAFGLVPAEHVKAVAGFIKSRGMACSVYGAQYLLEGLYKAGEAEYALSLMTATHDRGWYNMIKTGSTITMEAWDMKYKPNADLNHAWGTAPANIIPRYLWGIRPIEPGQKKIIINPQLATLTESKIKVPFKDGAIIAEYKKDGSIEKYAFTIPQNMNVEFVGDYDSKKVTVNNKKVKDKGGIRLVPGVNTLIFIQ